MFGWFAKKKLTLNAPVDGEVVELERVNDEVFSQKMAGDGVALIPSGDVFCAPISGTISKIFPTNHAFVVSASCVEVIVHIGIDTVKFGGEGFVRRINEGDVVSSGDAIISIDRAFLEANGADLTTPIVVNGSVNILTSGIVKSNQPIMEVVL